MKHFWALTIAAVLFAFTAQAGQLNNKPTLSGTKTVQPPPTLPSATPRSTIQGKHIKSGKLILRTDPQSGLPTGKRLHKPITGAASP